MWVAIVKTVGRTPEGRTVVAGTYQLFETHGVPLDTVLAGLWARDALPDWADLMRSMCAAGRPMERTVEAVCAAVSDAGYPPEFRDAVIRWIKLVAPKLELERVVAGQGKS